MNDETKAPEAPEENHGGEDQDRPPTKARRGFAAMTVEARTEIARSGGKAAHAQGVAHRFAKGSDLPREAGRKGGRGRQAQRRAERKGAST